MTDYSVPRDSRRVPLATRVQLKFEWFSGFISEYSANISPGGMFIRTQTPEPVGRMLGFEFRLGDGFELIQGTGEVMWVRPIDQLPEKPAGMGIRFLELSPHSRDLIEMMAENYVRQGGTPFDVGDVPVAPAPEPEPAALAAGSPPAASKASAPPSPAPPIAAPRSPSAAEGPFPTPAPPPIASAPLPPPSAAAVASARREETHPPPPWPGLLAEKAAAVAAEAHREPLAERHAPAFETVVERRPVRTSRILLWALFAVLLGGIAWAVLEQDALLGWVTGRGSVAAAPGPAASAPLVAAHRPPRAAAPRTAPAAAAAPVVPRDAASTPPAVPPAGQALLASPPAAVPAAIPLPASAPLTEIEKITWQQAADGTEVVLWGNGAFHRQDFVHYRVEGDPPRVLIKLRGIQHPFAEGRLIVGTRQLRQVRTGFHSEGTGNELHVVLDLSGFGVEVTGMQEDAERLRIFLKGS